MYVNIDVEALFCRCSTRFNFHCVHSRGRIWNPPLRSANPVAFCLPPTSAGWGHPALRPTKKGNVGRPALWPPCPLPATANLPCNPHTLTPQTKASLVKGRPDCRKIASLPYCVCRGDHWSPVSLPPQRNFRDSFHTRQTGTGEQCSPLQERFDTLLQP